MLAILAARPFGMPFFRRPSYCFSFFTPGRFPGMQYLLVSLDEDVPLQRRRYTVASLVRLRPVRRHGGGPTGPRRRSEDTP